MIDPSRDDLEHAASYLDTDVDDNDGVRRRRVAAFLRHEAAKPTMKEMADKIIGGLTDKEREALDAFNEMKRQMLSTGADQLLARLRIVRNAIVREWQRLSSVRSTLPSGVASYDLLKREMDGLSTAIFLLYNEFDELEPIPMDQKPRCPFCREEMEHPALSDHMKEHTRVYNGIPSAGLAQGPGIPLTDDMEIGPIHLVDDGPIEVMIEGIKYKTSYLRELMAEAVRDFHGKNVLFSSRFLEAAEGQGGAAHPDPDPEEQP